MMKKKKGHKGIILFFMALLFIYQMMLLVTHIVTYETITADMVFFAVIFLSMGLVIDAGVYFIYCRLQQKLELDEEFKKVYRYREQELKLYQGIQRQIEQLREKRHEFANQIQTAYIMFEQGASQEELEKYLQNMEERYQREWI